MSSEGISNIVVVIQVVLERWNVLLPGWVVLGEGTNGEHLTQLNNVCNFNFLKLQVRVKRTVVELPEETHAVSSWQIFFLAVIDGNFFHDFWTVFTLLWLWDLFEVAMVVCTNKSVSEFLVILALLQLLGSTWVEMSKVVEVLLSHALTLSVVHVGLIEWVVEDLKCFPVTLYLEKFIHMFFSCTITVFHDPSVEADQPNLFKHDLKFTGVVVINHLTNFLNSDSFIRFLTFTSFWVFEMISDSINELSEIFTDW